MTCGSQLLVLCDIQQDPFQILWKLSLPVADHLENKMIFKVASNQTIV